MRIEGLLCDVTLVAGDGDEAFPVHRAMMASSSDYFKAMFTGERDKRMEDERESDIVQTPVPLGVRAPPGARSAIRILFHL